MDSRRRQTSIWWSTVGGRGLWRHGQIHKLDIRSFRALTRSALLNLRGGVSRPIRGSPRNSDAEIPSLWALKYVDWPPRPPPHEDWMAQVCASRYIPVCVCVKTTILQSHVTTRTGRVTMGRVKECVFWQATFPSTYMRNNRLNLVCCFAHIHSVHVIAVATKKEDSWAYQFSKQQIGCWIVCLRTLICAQLLFGASASREPLSVFTMLGIGKGCISKKGPIPRRLLTALPGIQPIKTCYHLCLQKIQSSG